MLITGGSRGIGAETVRLFIKGGYETAFFYRNSEEEARRLSEETGAVSIKCDVSDPGQVKESVKNARICLGTAAFDAVVCNAGISVNGLFTELTDVQWEEILGVNLNGAVYVARETLPRMISRKAGSLIFVSSVWGETGASCEAAYSATKAAVIGLTKGLAKEVGPSGVRVNAVSPGVIDTEMNREHSAETMDVLKQDTPLNRIGRGEEVARAIYFLASDDASFITGQVLRVNGGFYI